MVWEIWKERNSWIFDGKTRKLVEAWNMIQNHTKEILGLKQWGSRDLHASLEERIILWNWGVTEISEHIGNRSEGEPKAPILEKWEPPPLSMYKLNFDGNYKGNPSPTGYRGAIRNSDGNPVGIYWGYIGMNLNNVVELRGLLEGLSMVVR